MDPYGNCVISFCDILVLCQTRLRPDAYAIRLQGIVCTQYIHNDFSVDRLAATLLIVKVCHTMLLLLLLFRHSAKT